MNADGGAAALERFCILAKNYKGRGLAETIQQVISDRKIFVFGELLAMPTVQALRGTEFEQYVNLVELFAYGTYADYRGNRAKYPDLSAVQTEKLRQLTIVSLAQQHESVPYAMLFSELDMSNVRELEDLLIETMYAGLISGRMHQREEVLHIKHSVGRDVRLEEVGPMIAKLSAWADRNAALLQRLELQTKELTSTRAAVETEQLNFHDKFDKVKAHVKANPVRSSRMMPGGMDGGDGYDDFDMMEGPGRKVGGRLKRNRFKDTPSRGARNK